MGKMIHEELSGKIIGVAMDVLNELKPGLDEKLYERAMVIELRQRGHQVEQRRHGRCASRAQAQRKAGRRRDHRPDASRHGARRHGRHGHCNCSAVQPRVRRVRVQVDLLHKFLKASGSEVLRHQLQSSMAALRYASRTEISCTPPQHGHLTRNLDFQDARRVRTSASTRVGARSFVFGQMKVSNGSAKAISCVPVNR